MRTYIHSVQVYEMKHRKLLKAAPRTLRSEPKPETYMHGRAHGRKPGIGAPCNVATFAVTSGELPVITSRKAALWFHSEGCNMASGAVIRFACYACVRKLDAIRICIENLDIYCTS